MTSASNEAKPQTALERLQTLNAKFAPKIAARRVLSLGELSALTQAQTELLLALADDKQQARRRKVSGA